MLLEDDKGSNHVTNEEMNERPKSPITLNESEQKSESIHSQSTSKEARCDSQQEEEAVHSNEKASEAAQAQSLSIPPLPKPLDSAVRQRSAPSVINHKNNHDQLSVSDHSPMVPPPPPPPMATLYNPVTGYSPGRSARKRIWVASNVHLPSSRVTRGHHPAPKATEDDSHTSSDVESFSSEEVLERWSAQIRAELRYAELVELAEEAERAAEAGQESYTGRPWLYAGGDNTDGELSPSPMDMRPSPIKRRASYSEGLPMPSSPLRVATGKTTLPQGVRNLRDAEDVFPSFENFHKNLRTHYLRCRVTETVLVFEEVAKVEGGDQSGAVIEHAHSFVGAQNLMDSFSDILRRRRSPRRNREGEIDETWGTMGIKRDESIDDEASNVGDVLAEHIHSETQPMRRPSHPMTLPGLPPLETTQPLGIGRSVSANHPIGRRTIGRSPSVEDDGLANPRILFPTGNTPNSLDLPGLIVDDGTSAIAPPATPTARTEQSQDFVTPARLREIRRPKNGDIQKFVHTHSMILPSNSVIQDSPFQKTPLSTSQGIRRNAPDNPHFPIKDLLLPAFSAGTEGDSSHIVHLAPSRSYDSWDDEMGPNPLSAEDKKRAAEMTNNPRTPPSTSTQPAGDSRVSPASKTHSPVSSLCLPSNDEMAAAAEVRVSILDKSLDSNGTGGNSLERRIVRPSTIWAENRQSKGQKVFTLRQLVSTTSDGSFDAVDCRCLSPAMVEDFRDRLTVNDGDESRDQHRKTRGPSPLEGAMNMLKKFNSVRGKKGPHARGLFVHPRVNDDFLQNYLYCTKDPQKDDQYNHPDNVCMSNESCEKVGFCGAGFMLGGYCDFMAREVDCTSALAGGRSRDPAEILPLSFDPRKHHATDADGWFDAATERVDGILENLIRGTSHRIDRFQPPSLRKIMRSEPRSSRRSATETVEEQPTTQVNTSSLSDRRPSVQALFDPTEGDLSDTQFALVYGVSRSTPKATTAATTSPLRDDVAATGKTQPVSLEVPISYSSSSDEEEGRLSLSVSMSYISEPSS
uniref:Uncharacterized protein n=1 Tax=Amphora coffeiformis TaxID=265554 RepID=A0A7S3L9C2_9STRA